MRFSRLEVFDERETKRDGHKGQRYKNAPAGDPVIGGAALNWRSGQSFSIGPRKPQGVGEAPSTTLHHAVNALGLPHEGGAVVDGAIGREGHGLSLVMRAA